MMALVADVASPVARLAESATWTTYAFPTTTKVDAKYVFSVAIGERYLRGMALLFPLLLTALCLTTPQSLIDIKAEALSKHHLAYAFIFGGLALYSAHFRWDDGFFVRFFGQHPVTFSAGGAVLLFLTAYSIRAAYICAFFKRGKV